MTATVTLPKRMVPKPWGRDTLPAPFAADTAERIGEIWFEPPAKLDELLVKYLFTSENLSVQVHPSDADAPRGRRGKDECWLIVGAERGARLALGLRTPNDPDTLRHAALDGSIETLLDWYEVAPGDFFYIPAGTIHAIGAGISLIEVQQNSDLTYRLYDYGRPRELHLSEALAAARLEPHDPALRRQVPAHGELTLVEGPRFRLDRLEGSPSDEALARYGERALAAIPLDGAITLGGVAVVPGDCAVARSLGEVRLAPGTHALVAQPV